MYHLSLPLCHQGGHSRHQKEKEKKRFWPLELQTLFRVDHTRRKKQRNAGGETAFTSKQIIFH